jgi:GNAT superfamily N-acetyltransferase
MPRTRDAAPPTAPLPSPSSPPDAPGTRLVLEVPGVARAIAGPLPLRDGATLYVRALGPEDGERLRAFHASLSAETIQARFFRALRELSASEEATLTRLDYVNTMALVATTGPDVDAALLAVTRYARIGSQEAEIAAVVQDQWQGRGIAAALLLRLAAYARAQGVTTFWGIIQASNSHAISALRASGFPCVLRSHFDGEITARLGITGPPQAPGEAQPVTHAQPHEEAAKKRAPSP